MPALPGLPVCDTISARGGGAVLPVHAALHSRVEEVPLMAWMPTGSQADLQMQTPCSWQRDAARAGQLT